MDIHCILVSQSCAGPEKLAAKRNIVHARVPLAMANASDNRAALHSLPGVTKERDDETKGFQFQQTMLRIKEPERSLDFYTRVLGMTLLTKLDFPSMKFTLYFLAYCDSPTDVPDSPEDRIESCMGRCVLVNGVA